MSDSSLKSKTYEPLLFNLFLIARKRSHSLWRVYCQETFSKVCRSNRLTDRLLFLLRWKQTLCYTTVCLPRFSWSLRTSLSSQSHSSPADSPHIESRRHWKSRTFSFTSVKDKNNRHTSVIFFWRYRKQEMHNAASYWRSLLMCLLKCNREKLEHQDPRIRVWGDSICTKVDRSFVSHTEADCSQQCQGSNFDHHQVTGVVDLMWSLRAGWNEWSGK